MGNGESSSKVGIGLAIGGAVVIALAAVLYFALKKDLSSDASPSPSTDTTQGSAVAVTTPTTPTVTPALPGEKPALPQPAPGENPRDYVVGDIRVRDHRPGDHKPLDIPPNVHPIEGQKIPSTLTHEVAQKVLKVVTDCVAGIPAAARSDKPRVEGQVAINIKDHKVTVTKSTMQLRNVSGESVEPAKQCIESKSIGIESAAPPELNDLDNYTINVSFAMP